MDINLSPEQNSQLKTWADLRDEYLRQNAVLTTENDTLTKSNKALAISNSDLESRINGHQGRIEILDKKEKERELLISQSVSALISKEKEFIAKVSGLQTEVNALVGRKGDLESMIKTLESLHEKIFDKVGVLGQVVDHVKRVGSENTDQANYLISNTQKAISDLIETVKILDNSLHDRTKELDMSVSKAISFNTKITEGDINKTNKPSSLG